MLRGLIFIAVLFLASLLTTGYLVLNTSEADTGVVQTEIVQDVPVAGIPNSDLVLAPFLRPDYIENKTWGLTVLECKVYASDKHEELIGIELDQISSPTDFERECLLTE